MLGDARDTTTGSFMPGETDGVVDVVDYVELDPTVIRGTAALPAVPVWAWVAIGLAALWALATERT